MSSILRALKKLDEDSMSPMSREQQDRPGKTMRKIVHRRTGASRRISRLFFISSIVLLLAAAGWFIINININTNGKHPITEKQASPKKLPLTLKNLPPHQQAPSLEKELKKESPLESKPPAKTGEQPAFPGSVSDPQALPPKEPEVSKIPGKHTGFILNGILWSHIPGRRVALINDRYLKEGDRVNGVSVLRIGKKAVTLQSGEEKWTITLKK